MWVTRMATREQDVRERRNPRSIGALPLPLTQPQAV